MRLLSSSRARLSLFGLLFTFLTANLLTAQTPAAGWAQRVKAGMVMYFTFATPARLERYDLVQERWLTSVALTASPTALHVDANAIYLAYGRAVAKRALDGSNERAVYNSASDINGLLGDATFLFVFTPSGGESRVASVRKSDDQYVNSWQSYYSLSSGYSIAPTGRRLYGVNTYTSSFSTIELPYHTDGSFGTAQERWSDTGGFYENARTWVYPNEQNVVRHNGMVYATPGLAYRASLAGSFDDADFYGSDVLIVLRGAKLHAYANTLLESGTCTLPVSSQALAVQGTSVYAFARDVTQTSGIAVTKLNVSQITAATPGAAIDPATTPFLADEIIAAGDDTFFLFSRSLQSVFRWSAATRRYTASLPLTGSPQQVAYSPVLRRLYLGYSSGSITQIKLDQGATTEVPFATLPLGVRGLQAAGNFVMAVDESGAWVTHYVFGSDGTLKTSKEWNYYSQEYIWSPGTRRLYFLRDDTSPNDLHYEVIDEAGQFGAAGETPYHGSYNFVHPVRISDDETGILVGSGVVFSASGLSYAGAMANNVLDATSLSNRWVTLRVAGIDSQVQTWTTNLLFDRGYTVPGEPLRIFDLSDGRAIVFTKLGGRTIISFVDFAGSGTITTSPAINADPQSVTSNVGLSITLSVDARGSDLSYQWLKDGVAISGATAATLNLSNLQLSAAGNYAVRVTNTLGTITSHAAVLTVNPPLAPAPTITRAPVSVTAGRGESVALSVVAAGTGLSYQWRKNGADLPGAINASLTLPALRESDAGSYTVRVTNTGGSVTSEAAIVSVVTITAQPRSLTVSPGASAIFSVVAESSVMLEFQWRYNGAPISGATGATLSLTDVAAGNAGSYDVVIGDARGTATSAAAILGFSSNAKVIGGGTERDPNVLHPNGNVFDQVLVNGAAVVVTADWMQNQITRASFIDLDDDIVQIEFSGPGTLSLVLDGYSTPALPVKYNQPVNYAKGHAGIVITGADERTNVSVFTVGRATAFDKTGAFNILDPISATNNPANNGSPLFDGHASTAYDGIADIAFIAITSTNGKFGGVRTANVNYFARKGFTGIYAPGVAFQGPLRVGDITAFDSAVPVILVGSVTDALITGGDLLQENGQPVRVSGLTRLRFVDGSTSGGALLTGQANRAVLTQDGVDVTGFVVVNPPQ